MKLVPSARMKKYLYGLIFIISAVSTGRIPRKRKAIDLSRINEKLTGYEWEHYNDYLVKKVSYEWWPELDREKQVQYCQNHLKKIFPKKNLNPIDASIVYIQFLYQEIYNNNGEKFATMKLTSLHCRIMDPTKNRKIFHFVRAPTLDCVYLLNRSEKNNGYYYISAHICDHHSYGTLKIEGELGIPGISKLNYREQKIYDSLIQREQYEWDHFQDYQIHKAKYIEWPEIHNKDPSDYCLHLFQRILPHATHSIVEPTYTTRKLLYKILQEKYQILDVVVVAALACKWPQRVSPNFFQFIRAPKNTCTYLIKCITSKQVSCQITKRLCEENEEGEKKCDNGEAESGKSKNEPYRGNETNEGEYDPEDKSNMDEDEPNKGGEDERKKGEDKSYHDKIGANQERVPNQFGIDEHQQTVEFFYENEKISENIEMETTVDINEELSSTNDLLEEMFNNDEHHP